MSKLLMIGVFVMVSFGFSSALKADEKKELSKSFSSYEELQAYYNYNAHFEDENLIMASRLMHNDLQEFCNSHSSIMDLQLANNYLNTTLAGYCGWGSSDAQGSHIGVVAINGVQYICKRLYWSVVAYNVGGYINPVFLASGAPGQTVTTTETRTTCDTTTWSANWSLSIDIWNDFVKLFTNNFGGTYTNSTQVCTTITKNTSFTFPTNCGNNNTVSWYIAMTKNDILMTYEIAPIIGRDDGGYIVDCAKATTAQMHVFMPHPVSYTVCSTVSKPGGDKNQ